MLLVSFKLSRMNKMVFRTMRIASNLGFAAVYSVLLSIVVATSISSQAAEYRIGHCLYGCPGGASEQNHLLLRPIYALSYNIQNKAADWAAYKVTAGSIGIASSLSRQTIVDDFVSDTLDESDFLNSAEQGLNQSQLVPLVNFAGTPYWRDINFLTNTVARSNSLSQGPWYGLEWSIRNFVNRQNDVFVIAGPIYKEVQTASQLQTSKEHRVPDGFFKIIVTEFGGGSAFLFDQEEPVHMHHCNLRTSIEEIESLTGLDFFPEIPRLNLESLDVELGCF